MIFAYFLALGFVMLSIGIAGVAASRHFIIMMLSIEIALTGAMVVAAASFVYSTGGGNVLGLLFTLWAVASAGIMAMVAVYRFLVSEGASMDVRELSKLRD